MTPPFAPVPPQRPGGPSRVIQGSFPGGQPRLPRPAAAPPPPATTTARPAAMQRAVVPGRPKPVQPAARPQPILPNAPRPGAMQPSAGNAFAVPPGFQLRPSALGRRLPEAVQQKMEAFFNASFADVRVHVGHEAASIGALAFTIGSDLYFAPGQYNPQTMQGQQLLGHELTHVVQQRAGRVRNPLGSGVAVVQDPALEAEAERMGLRAATVSPPVQAKSAGIGPAGTPSRATNPGCMTIGSNGAILPSRPRANPEARPVPGPILPTPPAIPPKTEGVDPIQAAPRAAIQPASRGPVVPRSVAGATRPGHPGRPGRAVQRKVGFEMEMSVPTFAATAMVVPSYLKPGPTRVRPSHRVQMFLLGGLPYGAPIGKNEHYRLTSDHNELQSKGRAIVVKLIDMGYVDASFPADKYLTVSNLEYVTEALDELAPNSTTAYTQQFAAVKAHMDRVLDQVKTTFKKIPRPAGAYYTGVPVDDLRAWLAHRYDELEPLIAEFQAAIHDSLYLQATVGIIPSALRDLHRAYLPINVEERDIIQKVATVADRWVDQMMAALLRVDDEYVKDLTTPATGTFSSWSSKKPQVEREAFEGLLQLCLMYVIGSALNQTNFADGSSQKNTVMFLSKMNLGKVRGDAMTSYQGGLLSSDPPDLTIRRIADYISQCELTRVDYWLRLGLEDRRGREGRGAYIRNIETFVRGVFLGNEVQAVNTGRSRQLEADAMPDAVKRASAGQRGIPVEYRHIADRPKPAGMKDALMKIVRDVRLLNIKHLSGDEQVAIIEAADR